jgi:hypothetical protein
MWARVLCPRSSFDHHSVNLQSLPFSVDFYTSPYMFQREFLTSLRLVMCVLREHRLDRVVFAICTHLLSIMASKAAVNVLAKQGNCQAQQRMKRGGNKGNLSAGIRVLSNQV